MRNWTHWPPTSHRFRGRRARIEALRASLDAIFAAAEQALDTSETDLIFVPHPRAYTLRHISNTAVAGWLTQLGCEVRAPAIIARWRIHEPTTGESR